LKTRRFAIIGAGIAGCSAALFLRDLFPAAEIIVFEARRLPGGRISTAIVDGRPVEVGASFLHSSNGFLRSLVERAGLTLERSHGIGLRSALAL